MMRIAAEVARRLGASALVTGDSLGQVASQTLANLAVVEEASGLPVLRPLVGMGKDEITADARRFGTFEISAEPDQDCCTRFVPRHPDTGARLEAIRRYESRLDLEGLVRAALDAAEVERWFYPQTARDPEREALRPPRAENPPQPGPGAEEPAP
jgi:thiamine biosynthesis protein ThiI